MKFVFFVEININFMDIKEILESLKWEDFSIMTTKDHGSFLVLLCSDIDEAEKLYTIITKNPFNFKLITNDDWEGHRFEIELLNTEWNFGLKSPQTIEKYPPLKLLYNKQVNGITCGFDAGQGKIHYNPNIHPLEGANILLN